MIVNPNSIKKSRSKKILKLVQEYHHTSAYRVELYRQDYFIKYHAQIRKVFAASLNLFSKEVSAKIVKDFIRKYPSRSRNFSDNFDYIPQFLQKFTTSKLKKKFVIELSRFEKQLFLFTRFNTTPLTLTIVRNGKKWSLKGPLECSAYLWPVIETWRQDGLVVGESEPWKRPKQKSFYFLMRYEDAAIPRVVMIKEYNWLKMIVKKCMGIKKKYVLKKSEMQIFKNLTEMGLFQ